MMRILFTACPMFGHVNTLLPLALAARRAGHSVVLATGADHVGRVAAMGLTTWAVGPTYAQAGWPPRSPVDFAAPADKRCVDLLPLAEQWGPDVVVLEEIEATGAVVAARTGARLVVHSSASPRAATARSPRCWTTWARFLQLAGGSGAGQRILGRLVELAQMGLLFVHLPLGGLVFGVYSRNLLVHVIFGRTAAKTESSGDYGCGCENGASNSHR